jgi:hypothetical protein
MKSLSIGLRITLVVIGLSIFTYAEVWGADWKYVGETMEGKVFYDATSITRPSKNIVRVCAKIVYTEKGVIGMIEEWGSRCENLGNALHLLEFNCSDKMERLLTQDYYSKNGEVIESVKNDMATWEFVISGSVGEKLYKAVCK